MASLLYLAVVAVAVLAGVDFPVARVVSKNAPVAAVAVKVPAARQEVSWKQRLDRFDGATEVVSVVAVLAGVDSSVTHVVSKNAPVAAVAVKVPTARQEVSWKQRLDRFNGTTEVVSVRSAVGNQG